jgi:hypothetical protein
VDLAITEVYKKLLNLLKSGHFRHLWRRLKGFDEVNQAEVPSLLAYLEHDSLLRIVLIEFLACSEHLLLNDDMLFYEIERATDFDQGLKQLQNHNRRMVTLTQSSTCDAINQDGLHFFRIQTCKSDHFELVLNLKLFVDVFFVVHRVF